MHARAHFNARVHMHTQMRTGACSQGRALQCIPGLSEEALAVVWTMIDCVDGESPYAPYWR